MNCCGGEHKHGEKEPSGSQHDNNGSGSGWMPIAALLLIAVLVGGLLFAFLK
ncbi:MAG TPA: hypothetical protein VJH23_05705 [archaeon]|nr:hypothetical protein [archaeon]